MRPRGRRSVALVLAGVVGVSAAGGAIALARGGGPVSDHVGTVAPAPGVDTVAPASRGGPAPHAPSTAVGSAASCVMPNPTRDFVDARLVIVGKMLSGPTAGGVLLSPARMRVEKYLKGHGPKVVTVQTGATKSGGVVSIAEDAVMPRPGQRWKIYTSSTSTPFAASICSGSERLRAGQDVTPIPEPANFVAIARSRGRWVAELRSPQTGRTIRVLRRLGSPFTNNGLALTPDGRQLYYTLISCGRSRASGRARTSGLCLMRIDTHTRRRSFVALGAQPAVSGDGRLLAYAGGRNAAIVVVRGLDGSGTRRLKLGRLLRGSGGLLDGTLTWLGDGTLVLQPGPQAIATAAGTSRSPGAAARSGGCAATGRVECLIVVTVPPRGPLHARRLELRVPQSGGLLISGELDRLHALLAANVIGPHAALYRVSITGSKLTHTRLMSLPRDSLIVGFDPGGERILYLLGHHHPQLWTAWIGKHRLNRARMLGRDTTPVAW